MPLWAIGGHKGRGIWRKRSPAFSEIIGLIDIRINFDFDQPFRIDEAVDLVDDRRQSERSKHFPMHSSDNGQVDASAALELIDTAAYATPVAGFPGKRLPKRGERLLRAHMHQCPTRPSNGVPGSALASALIRTGSAGA